jgi:hypothetical protein
MKGRDNPTTGHIPIVIEILMIICEDSKVINPIDKYFANLSLAWKAI